MASKEVTNTSKAVQTPLNALRGALLLQAGQHVYCPRLLAAHPRSARYPDILPASTWDWIPTLSGGSFKWYLQRMAGAVQQLADRYGSPVCLVGDGLMSTARDLHHKQQEFKDANNITALAAGGSQHLI